MSVIDEVNNEQGSVLGLAVDQKSNYDFEGKRIKCLRMLHESSPDPHTLSVISDCSVMGQEMKQSITYSEMIKSTFSDLKNLNKSNTLFPYDKKDPDIILKKYNMLSLAIEFSKWKESSADLDFGDSLSDRESKNTKEDCGKKTTVISCSPSLLSDLSSLDYFLEFHNNEDKECKEIKEPTEVNNNQKLDETFSGYEGSSDSETFKDNKRNFLQRKIVRPAWAQSIFHRETLVKMPKSIRLAASSIRNFDISMEKYLKMLKLSQLYLIMKCLISQIEELNESLVVALIARDEIKTKQASIIIQVEELTIKAKSEAQLMKNRGKPSKNNYGIVHRFLSNIMRSPKFATNRLLSFFTEDNVAKLPLPEYVPVVLRALLLNTRDCNLLHDDIFKTNCTPNYNLFISSQDVLHICMLW